MRLGKYKPEVELVAFGLLTISILLIILCALVFSLGWDHYRSVSKELAVQLSTANGKIAELESQVRIAKMEQSIHDEANTTITNQLIHDIEVLKRQAKKE